MRSVLTKALRRSVVLALLLRRPGRHRGRQGDEGPRPAAPGLHPLRRPAGRRGDEEDRRRGRLRDAADEPEEGRELRRHLGGPRAVLRDEAVQGELPPADGVRRGRAGQAGAGEARHGEGRLHRPDPGHGLDRHRRQEPRGGPRDPDAAGLAPRGRGVERARRLPEAEDPVRARGQQRQRPVGLLGQRDHQAGLQGRGLGHAGDDRRGQQPHRDPGRPQGRGPDDQLRRHRPDLHRDEHPVGGAGDRRRPAAGVPADRLLVPQAEPEEGGDHPREQPLRPLRGARDPRQRAAAAAARPDRDGLQGGAEGLQARGRAGQEREPRRGRALGRRGRGRPRPQHDARDGHDAALLRLRPHGERGVREARREERGGRGGGVPLEPRAEGPEARAVPEGLPRAVRRGGRDLRRARLRRDEPDALGHQRGRPQPRQDPRPDRVPAAPVAGRHGRHRLLGLPRRRGRHLPRHVRARRLEVRLAHATSGSRRATSPRATA